MKAPAGLLSDRTVLHSKMEGPRPDKFRVDESAKKRYTISRRCSSAAGCRGVAQLVARLLWEQEAASSSLATPTMRKATMKR